MFNPTLIRQQKEIEALEESVGLLKIAIRVAEKRITALERTLYD
jgi:hypothetical protein